jgi:hypothetical protein
VKPSKCRNLLLLTSLTAVMCTAELPQRLLAQAAPGQSASTAARLLGTVTSTGTDSITLKLESGGEAVITVNQQTRMVRTAPGEKTLAGAMPIQLSDLAPGDRILVRATPGPDATHFTAGAVIAMKSTDIAQAHASEAEDWQKRGVGGVVKSIDTANAAGSTAQAAVVLSTGLSGRTVSLLVTPSTNIRRYAPDSIKFSDSKAATLADIHVGDQVRARGEHAADGLTVTAVELVAGSFRNIAGTITSIDPSQNMLTVSDLATKKPVALHLTADTQMRKLPPEVAQRLSARVGGGAGGGNSSATASGNRAGGAGASSSAGGAGGGAGADHGREGAGAAPAGIAGQEGRPRGDAASMLQRAPSVTLAELKKGDAVMIVSTQGTGGANDGATAITLISGVEPLLQGSPGASQNLFSASWNLEGGGGGGESPQ